MTWNISTHFPIHVSLTWHVMLVIVCGIDGRRTMGRLTMVSLVLDVARRIVRTQRPLCPVTPALTEESAERYRLGAGRGQ